MICVNDAGVGSGVLSAGSQASSGSCIAPEPPEPAAMGVLPAAELPAAAIIPAAPPVVPASAVVPAVAVLPAAPCPLAPLTPDVPALGGSMLLPAAPPAPAVSMGLSVLAVPSSLLQAAMHIAAATT